MDIPCCIHDICLVYVCAYTPRSGFNIVYSCVHTLSHDYTTALTIYGYVCAHTPRKDFNIVYIHYHVSKHWVIAYERAVLTSRDSQQPIRDHAPTWRRMGIYFTLYILLTFPNPFQTFPLFFFLSSPLAFLAYKVSSQVMQ